MTKLRNVIPIILIVVLAYLGHGIIATNPSYVLYTRIASYDDYLVSYLDEGCSNGLSSIGVTFPVEIEIWNPFEKSVVVTTANYDLFDSGVYIEFENETYTYEVGGIELPAQGYYEIPPKLSRYNYTIQFVICTENSTTLPYGYYAFWGEIDSDKSIRFISRFLEANETGNFFTEDELPISWGMVLYTSTETGFAWLSIFSLTLVYFYKKVRFRKKNR